MNVIETSLPDVLIIEPKVFGDERGFFMESFQEQRYHKAGIKGPFVQDNVSYSRRGVLRGLHLQNPNPQGKLVYVLEGSVFDVAVDLRVSSPSFGRWFGTTLSRDNKRQLWVPPGFAHGFLVTSDFALFCYKVTSLYQPEHEATLQWDDPALGIDWPLTEQPSLSTKDVQGLPLSKFPKNKLYP